MLTGGVARSLQSRLHGIDVKALFQKARMCLAHMASSPQVTPTAQVNSRIQLVRPLLGDRSDVLGVQSWDRAPSRPSCPGQTATSAICVVCRRHAGAVVESTFEQLEVPRWQNRYGEAALMATHGASSAGTDPVALWQSAMEKLHPTSPIAQSKGGPRGAFLGLCEEGLVKGIPAGRAALHEA